MPVLEEANNICGCDGWYYCNGLVTLIWLQLSWTKVGYNNSAGVRFDHVLLYHTDPQPTLPWRQATIVDHWDDGGRRL